MPKWKREQYMDASGAWRMPEDDYIDYSGCWRRRLNVIGIYEAQVCLIKHKIPLKVAPTRRMIIKTFR